MAKKNETVTEKQSDELDKVLNSEQQGVKTEPLFPEPEKKKDLVFKTVSDPLNFWDFAKEKTFTGIFLGAGKEIQSNSGGKRSTKTWVLKDLFTGKNHMIPQHDGVKVLADEPDLGGVVYRVTLEKVVEKEDSKYYVYLVEKAELPKEEKLVFGKDFTKADLGLED